MKNTLTLKKIIFVLAGILVLVSILILYYIEPTNINMEKYAHADAKSSTEDGWNNITQYGYKTIVCDNNLLKPQIVNVTKQKGRDKEKVFAAFTKIKRENIFTNEFILDKTPNDGESTEIYNLPFDEVVKLFKQKGCDFFKRNTDTPDNIEINGYKPVIMTYYPPATQAEIKKLQDEKKRTDEFMRPKSNVEKIQQYCIDEKKLYDNALAAFQRGESFTNEATGVTALPTDENIANANIRIKETKNACDQALANKK